MDHLSPDGIIERDPGLTKLRSECWAELLQTPDQRITKRIEVVWAHSEICMLPTRVPDDRLKQFPLIKCPDDCRDHVHDAQRRQARRQIMQSCVLLCEAAVLFGEGALEAVAGHVESVGRIFRTATFGQLDGPAPICAA